MPKTSKWKAQHVGCQAAVDGVKADLTKEIEQLQEAWETADSVAQMAAHDRDEALENFVRVEQEYAALQASMRPIYHYAHEEHAHVRLGDRAHDPDCMLCDQIDALYLLLTDE